MSKEITVRNSSGSFGCLGGVVAFCLSWIVNKSIVWSVLHFFCSWIYVIYWVIFRSAAYDWLCSIAR